MKKLKEFWESLDDVATVSKRELFLELVSCVLAGLVLGMLFSPKQTKIIGCNNGNNCLDTDADTDDQLED